MEPAGLFAQRLVNGHGPHVKAADTRLHRNIDRWISFVLHTIEFRAVRLLLNHSDVRCGCFEGDIALGGPRQLLELTLVPAPPEGATPRCR